MGFCSFIMLEVENYAIGAGCCELLIWVNESLRLLFGHWA